MEAIKLHIQMISTLPLNFFPNFFIGQFWPLPVPGDDFTGKTVIVTGANVGLGKEVARHFTRLGAAKVILGCRDGEKGEAAKEDIESSTGRKGAVEVWPLDLDSFESVKEFCRRAQQLGRIDAVVENAAIALPTFQASEGYERNITVNVISTFLMALLLLPKLRETATKHNITPRLTVISSDGHFFAKFNERSSQNIFETFKSKEWMSDDRYNTSKMLEVLLLRELADATSARGNDSVILNCVNPGFCRSQLFRHALFPLNYVIRLNQLLVGRTNEMGSRTLYAGATAGVASHGKYMDQCRVSDPSPFVKSEEGIRVGKKLFHELLEVLEGVQPGISSNL